MLDRVTISDTKDGFVRIGQSDKTGIDIAVSVIPQSEWKELRDKIIGSKELNGDFSQCLDYLAALWVLLEQS